MECQDFIAAKLEMTREPDLKKTTYSITGTRPALFIVKGQDFTIYNCEGQIFQNKERTNILKRTNISEKERIRLLIHIHVSKIFLTCSLRKLI